MLELKNITKAYGKGTGLIVALDDVSLTIDDGEFVAIVGKSGSGKSTLLNIIGALDKPSSGSVFYNEKEITNMRDNALAEYRNKNIGFVFQSFYLEPTFSVLENVAMPLAIANVKKKQRDDLAKKAIIRMGLEDKCNAMTKELSGGQKQRVSIARAIATDPNIILADEPTGNLDVDTGKDVIEVLKQLNCEGKTIILVTHNLGDAYNCDRVIEIEKGRIKRVTVGKADCAMLPTCGDEQDIVR